MSIPTSLIVVILVAAWLAVLVPMVARRREAVPETDADGSTFRVLRRAPSVRRRPKLRRRDELEEDDLMDDQAIDEAADEEDLHEELLDHDELDEDDLEGDEFDDVEEEAEPEPVRRRGGRGRGRRAAETVATIETQTYQAEYYDSDTDTREIAYAGDRPARSQRGRKRSRATAGQVGSRSAPGQPRSISMRRACVRCHAGPVAVATTRMPRKLPAAYRYSRRRRIAVVLLLATHCLLARRIFLQANSVGRRSAFSGCCCSPTWAISAARSTSRRTSGSAGWPGWRGPGRSDRSILIGHDESPGRVGSFRWADLAGATAGYRRGREIVDLEDDDPSFDDLEYYQPVTYRRASGQ